MPENPPPSAPGSRRSLRPYEIGAIVLLTYNYPPPRRHGEGLGRRIAINNSMHVAVPALFGALGAVIGLAPVFWSGAVILLAGGWMAHGRRAAQ